MSSIVLFYMQTNKQTVQRAVHFMDELHDRCGPFWNRIQIQMTEKWPQESSTWIMDF